jgi:Na+/proline symporter
MAHQGAWESRLVGRFSKRVNAAGAIACMVIGLLVGIYLTLFTTLPPLTRFVPEMLIRINFFYVSPLLVPIYVAAMYGMSWSTPPLPAQACALLSAPKTGFGTVTRSWYQRDGLWAKLYLVCAIGMCLVF